MVMPSMLLHDTILGSAPGRILIAQAASQSQRFHAIQSCEVGDQGEDDIPWDR